MSHILIKNYFLLFIFLNIFLNHICHISVKLLSFKSFFAAQSITDCKQASSLKSYHYKSGRCRLFNSIINFIGLSMGGMQLPQIKCPTINCHKFNYLRKSLYTSNYLYNKLNIKWGEIEKNLAAIIDAKFVTSIKNQLVKNNKSEI